MSSSIRYESIDKMKSEGLNVCYEIAKLFEENLPTTFPIALFVSIALSSMGISDSIAKKPLSLLLVARYGIGKTSILSSFADVTVYSRQKNKYIKMVNMFDNMTRADYLIKYCGLFLDETQQVPRDLPFGVAVTIDKGKIIYDKTSCEDRINYTYDIIHGAEGMFKDKNSEQMIALYNSLIEQGYWEGGNRMIGRYIIGSVKNKVKHGIIIGIVPSDFQSTLIRKHGFLSRLLTVFYSRTPNEQKEILLRRIPNSSDMIEYKDFTRELNELLAHLDPTAKEEIRFSNELKHEDYLSLTYKMSELRDDPEKIRTHNDMLTLLASLARLNKDKEVKRQHYDLAVALSAMMNNKTCSAESFATQYLAGPKVQLEKISSFL